MTNIITTISEISSTLLETFMTYILVRKFKNKNSLTKSDLFNIILCCSIVLFINYKVSLFSPICIIISNLYWFIWAVSSNNKTKYREIFFQLILIDTIIFLSDTISLFPAQFIFNISFNTLINESIHRVIATLFSKILTLLIMRYCCSFKVENLIENPKYFLRISFIFIFYIISNYILSFHVLDIEKTLNELSISISLVIFIIDCLILASLQSLIEFSNRYNKFNIIEENYELQKHIINKQNSNIDSIRKVQHEYKNNLSAINALLMSNNIDEAKIMLTKILNISSNVTDSIKSTSFLELIVNYKLLEAKTKNIKTYHSITVPRDIPIDDQDIAILLNNSLNNAIEACMKLDISSRYIKCRIFIKGKYINFYFENPCINYYLTDTNGLISTKPDKNSHGFGIRNIKSIVTKYNGLLKYDFSDSKYILKFSLLIPENP